MMVVWNKYCLSAILACSTLASAYVPLSPRFLGKGGMRGSWAGVGLRSSSISPSGWSLGRQVAIASATGLVKRDVNAKGRADSRAGIGAVAVSLGGNEAGIKPLIISGPSGVGKGTLIKMLQEEFGESIKLCVSHTTRKPRPGEVNGVHYYFCTREEMEQGIADQLFLEHANVHGNLYGTARSSLEAMQREETLCTIDVDVQGCRSLRAAGVDGTYVFVAPPSKEALEERLRGRGTEEKDVIARRVAAAQREVEASGEAGLYDHIVYNADLDMAYGQLKSLLEPSLKSVAALRSVSSALSASATLDREASSSISPAAESSKDRGENARPTVVFVLGGPGSGKGTQCSLLVQRFNCVHLSAGDLLRAEQKNQDSPYSALINSCITEGKIVPVAITCRLLVRAMEASLEERGSGAAEPVFLIDGFPRNLDNLDGWVSEACQTARAVLFFECAEETLEQRLLERGKTSGRSDDNLASIKKRFKTFQSETMPVVEIFEGDGTLHKIQAEQGQSVEDVFRQVEKVLAVAVPDLKRR